MEASNVVSSGEKNYKYFIGYKYDDHKIKCIMLPKTNTYAKCYDGETAWMCCFDNNELLETYNGIWNRICNSTKKELDCEPIYNISENQNKVFR